MFSFSMLFLNELVRKQNKMTYVCEQLLNIKTGKHIPNKLKQGFLATAVREFYTDLGDVKHNDDNSSKALKFAKNI